jgi:hypothetical protein
MARVINFIGLNSFFFFYIYFFTKTYDSKNRKKNMEFEQKKIMMKTYWIDPGVVA